MPILSFVLTFYPFLLLSQHNFLIQHIVFHLTSICILTTFWDSSIIMIRGIVNERQIDASDSG